MGQRLAALGGRVQVLKPIGHTQENLHPLADVQGRAALSALETVLEVAVRHVRVDQAAGLAVVGIAQNLYDVAVLQPGQFADFVVKCLVQKLSLE